MKTPYKMILVFVPLCLYGLVTVYGDIRTGRMSPDVNPLSCVLSNVQSVLPFHHNPTEKSSMQFVRALYVSVR